MNRLKLLIISLLFTTFLFPMEYSSKDKEYTVNFENVELKELLKYISKIGNLNLIYNESEISGNVTFVSDKPTSLNNIKSALIQILRIHGLSLIEDGNNLIIHKNPAIKQMPTVVSSENPISGETPAIMTRVFNIKRGNPTNIASILTPLLSASAMIEVSIDTRQIIVTDVASSIDTIEQLLASLDMPETPYKVHTYEANNMGVLELQIFAQKIMAPLTKNTILEIVAQPDSNVIFIISTPFLIDRTVAVLEEIDKDINLKGPTNHRLTTSNVLIYQLKHKDKESTLSTLYSIIKESKNQGIATKELKALVDHANYLRSNNSLVFVGMPVNLSLVLGLLNNIDIPNTFSGSLNASFILYEPKTMNADNLLKILDEISHNLDASDYPNKKLLKSLSNASPIYDLQSVLFITTPEEKVELMSLLDSITASYSADIKKTGISHFYLYNIQHSSEEQIRDSLCCLQEHLKKNKYSNKNLLEAICSIQWIKASNSLFFVGSTHALQELANILPSFDVGSEQSREILTQSPPSTEFVVYTPKISSSVDLKAMVLETFNKLKTSDLSDPAFMKTINSIKILPSSNQLIFTGVKASLDRLMILLEKLDTGRNTKLAVEEIFIYAINHLSFEELEKILNGIGTHTKALEKDPNSLIAATISGMRYISDTNSIQFVGSKDTIEKIKELLAQIDSPNNKNTLDNALFIYKAQTMSPNELISHLKSIVKTTQKGKTRPTDLYYAVQSVKYVKQSGNLIFVGTKAALAKIKVLLQDLDEPMQTTIASPDRHVEGYQIYVPQNRAGPELIDMVTSFESHLVNSGMTNEALSEVIDHLTFVQKTNTIIISGEKTAVEEVISLLKQFDNNETPTLNALSDKESTTQGFLLYKIQNIEGENIVNSLKRIANSLKINQLNSKETSKVNRDIVAAINTIQWIKNTNSLIASGPPNTLTRLEQLLKSIDRPVRQVFIEVLVIDSNVVDNNTFGLSWQNKGTIYKKFGYSLANLGPQSDSPAIPFAQNLNKINESTSASGNAIPALAGSSLGIIGDIIFHNGKSYSSIGSLLNALKTAGNTTVVLSQKIVAQDNKNAKIFSGDNVPFTGSLVTTSGLSQTSNANLEYRNIGVTLSITPNISSDGMITLEIDQEISEEINTGDSSSNQGDINNRMINGIRTSKTNMTTTVRVPDKHFLILSGTMKNTSSRSVAGIPCLGGLPLIGAAFSHTEKSVDNHNVVMFVKPHIIENTNIFKEITNTQENIFSDKTQSHVEDFNEALELIQSPYDVDSSYDDLDDDDDDDDFYEVI